MNPHVRLFHIIAPGYRLFFRGEQRMFRRIVAEHARTAGAEVGDSFLDVGCGTGALLSVLGEEGYQAEGLDAAPNMVRMAQGVGMKCQLGDIAAGLPYPDCSFDFVTATFVAHGLPPSLRSRLYEEAGRVARKAVIIHDYYGRQSFLTEMIERLEGGDYFRFVDTGQDRMREIFDELDVIDVGGGKAWYVGRVYAGP